MAEIYNPLQHSIVQASVGSWERFECDDFVESLLSHVLEEIKRVHWNVYQHQWGPTWHSDDVEDPQIPGISFVRYYQDLCDCGGLEPRHAPDCDQPKLHRAWNDRRLEYLSEPDPNGFGRRLFFDEVKEQAFRAIDPRPTCACEENWDEDRGCVDTCVGQRPNFQHEDVCFKWYKHPGRGLSTNKNWSAEEWRAWQGRCLKTVRDFDRDWTDEKRVYPELKKRDGSVWTRDQA